MAKFAFWKAGNRHRQYKNLVRTALKLDMDTTKIMGFLRDIAAHNNREWFLENRKRYDHAREEFENGVEELLHGIMKFDPSIANLTVKDCTYRFYRDVRFSSDKAPYKRHFGAFINAKGRKALRGGYYMHLQPGNCFIAVGSYWLPTNILTACRNEIMANIDTWRKAVENGKFVKLFGYAGGNGMGEYTNGDTMPPKGFGTTHLKKAPKDFPKDYEFMDYLRMKDYCGWHSVPDDFFKDADWVDKTTEIFRTGKPMMDFINAVIDDYE